jgi:MtN3 and saliva related transmembrane protein
VKPADLIGWASSAILLATIGRQVYTQWKTKATAGVSRYLFVGQLTASTGFTIYSFMLHNWVFLTSNVALLATAVTGQILYSKNKKLAAPRQAREQNTEMPA